MTDVRRHGSRERGMRQVELDDLPVERRQRVVERPTVVRQGARVHNDRRDPAAGAVHRGDEVALVLALDVLEQESLPPGGAFGPPDVVGERRRAVDGRLAFAEQSEVRTREEEDDWFGHAVLALTSCDVARPGPAACVATSVDRDERGVDLRHELDAVGAVEHETEPAPGLFVPRHEHQELVEVDLGGDRRGKAVALDDGHVALDVGGADPAERRRQSCREDEADRDGFAVPDRQVGQRRSRRIPPPRARGRGCDRS